jgi:hypothetical protein
MGFIRLKYDLIGYSWFKYDLIGYNVFFCVFQLILVGSSGF